ncbi:protein of unknown function [Andreprevotia lacus DSM 23236]|jgi:hypothetical protein|uniref:DUF4274 domain-containing protein n=1 Tax=Andreprevotia lacus DSM 23236 TaxID=1121001 RepID=A0A1W1Y133_9NEIS|nr:DUF4274 domain-containing protein [Andreprevotia lacus]SMC29920.1 protein of unknown function [Andreprevotia lacus DSM 23236]
MSDQEDIITAQIWALVREYLQQATPEALHVYAARSNYDDNDKGLRLLIDNPKLDRGTALLLFWYLGADYHARRTVEELEGDELAADDLIQLVQARFMGGFYTDSNIFFSPRHSDLRPDDYESDGPIKREIPAIMYLPTDGLTNVDLDDSNYDEGLPLPVVHRIFALLD